jgi:uncharacterized membrane protein YhdT
MDVLSKLSREAQAVLGGGLLLLILSFLDWQQASFSFGTVGGTVGLSEWHGFVGTLAALLVIAMLVWEVLRVMAVNVSLGSLTPGLVSAGLALLMVVFTVIAFLTKGDARHWPAWIALIVALLVGAAAAMRARAEGVEMPQGMPAMHASAPPAAPSAPPAEPTEPMEGPAE